MRWNLVWGEFKRDRFIRVVAVVAFLLMLLTVFGPFLVEDPHKQDIVNRLKAPGEMGIMGTDELGRSVFARVTYGLRTSFAVGFAAVLLGFVVGVGLGLVAGYAGGWVDSLIMRIVDIQLSLPALLIAAAIMVTSGGSMLVLIIVLGLTSWTFYARVARTLVLRYRATDFVLSTRSLGAGSGRIIGRHLFPNILPSMIAIATLEFARIMLAEASLSFLGFGIQPPTISIGTILAGGRDYLVTQWWVTAFSGLMLALAVLTLNLLGSWLERVSNPTAALGRDAVPASSGPAAPGGPADTRLQGAPA
jgi:peptide/nickel transport system permease protein